MQYVSTVVLPSLLGALVTVGPPNNGLVGPVDAAVQTGARRAFDTIYKDLYHPTPENFGDHVRNFFNWLKEALHL